MSFLKNIKTYDDILTDYKNSKNKDINLVRDKELMSFFYNGKEFETTSKDMENILGQMIKISLGDIDDVIWITKDNSNYTFTSEEFVAFANMIAERKKSLIFKARKIKDSILSSKTKEEVDIINW